VAVIPLVHRNGTARASIRRGLPRRGVRLVSCRSVERARTLLERELVDAVVVDVRHGWADGAFELAHDYSAIPIVAYSPFRPDDGALIAACRRAGLDTVLVEGVDDYAAGELIWARSATHARRAALADAPRMLRLTEPIQLKAWEEVLTRSGTPTSTADIARALRRTREHLSREFAAGGAPNLKRVIDLARTAWAADLLTNPAYNVTAVAQILGFASASHLASTARRVAGVTAGQLAGLGPRGVMLRFVKGRTRSRVG
jgi:AraC-like DNA-binding protein